MSGLFSDPRLLSTKVVVQASVVLLAASSDTPVQNTFRLKVFCSGIAVLPNESASVRIKRLVFAFGFGASGSSFCTAFPAETCGGSWA